jgi:catechol 2,3-dioxygenase-like lactoylglutathione lyase family enzyme
MLGRFHEISIETADIRASVEFYERLGFSQASTGDTWPHPYGVLTDGRLFIGLHHRQLAPCSITYVRPDIAQHATLFESRGIELELFNAGEESFNEIAFRDPSGNRISVLEARTYSPIVREALETSLCGYFSQLSLTATDFDTAARFWEMLGFVATDELETPYVHRPLTSDHLDIAFHRPRTWDGPMLVFTDARMRERIEKLRALEVPLSRELPRGVDPKSSAVIETPEGTTLLLLEEPL